LEQPDLGAAGRDRAGWAGALPLAGGEEGAAADAGDGFAAERGVGAEPVLTNTYFVLAGSGAAKLRLRPSFVAASSSAACVKKNCWCGFEFGQNRMTISGWVTESLMPS